MERVREPDDVDMLVSSNMRRLRILRAATQKKLAEKLGISYQQVQKYESGANRLTAGRLVQVAEALRCSTIDLFHGVDTPTHAELESLSRSAMSAAVLFDAIDDRQQKHALLLLLSSLVDESAFLPPNTRPE